WTDASVKQEKAGACIFIRRRDGTEEEACIRLENGIKSRVAEFLAIHEAIRILEEHGDMHAMEMRNALNKTNKKKIEILNDWANKVINEEENIAEVQQSRN
ncbi:hypothetical protein GWI33_011795, partial [Rhynchophorus ferrugineus]